MSQSVDLSGYAERIRKAANDDPSEDSIKLAIEPILRREIIDPLQIGVSPKYQYTLLSGTRPDALYGHLIIDYKRSNLLSVVSQRNSAVEQVKGYITELGGVPSGYGRFLGVLIDGFSVIFIRYRRDSWEIQGPVDINESSLGKLIEALRGLARKPLDVQLMIQDFGPSRPITREMVTRLYESLSRPSKQRTKDLFDDWKRVFMQVVAYSPAKVEGLKTVYGMKGTVDSFKLFFAIHTFYALIMKLIAAEVTVLYSGGRLVHSYIAELEEAGLQSDPALRKKLLEIETGELFRTFLKVENFIEADYFTWYLDEWDESIASKVRDIAGILAQYEPGTGELEPEYVKDLFKGLYQNLVPKPIRHDLGEYFTPDWLAELVMQRSGLLSIDLEKHAIDGQDPLTMRVLDPSCGSGTFLVKTIKEARAYFDEHFVDRHLVLKSITENIVGYDLNPLAYIAARVNYLLALGDLLRGATSGIQIPVFLADSIMIETRTTLEGNFYVLRTSVGEFSIPVSLGEKNLLHKVLSVVDSCLKSDYTMKDFRERLTDEFREIDQVEQAALNQLYSILRKLEQEKRNRIWTGLIKNSFAPLFSQKFDFIIGNPPWISWESLPNAYRVASRPLWEKYGLLTSTRSRGMGKAKRDLAMLFVTICIDRYLKEKGVLCFLIPYTLFKSQAGAGFRRYVAGHSEICMVDDLVELAPFEGAINRTSMIQITNGRTTTFPIASNSWLKRHGLKYDFDSSLAQVIGATLKHETVMEPVRGRNATDSPWLLAKKDAIPAIKKVLGSSEYESHKGVNFNLNGAFWVEILENRNSHMLIRNLGTQVGRLRVDGENIPQITKEVESKFLFPLVRGRDVSRWRVMPSAYVLLPTDNRGKTIPAQLMKKRYPRTYEFLYGFFKFLIFRGGEPYKSQLQPYREKRLESAEKIAPPFYYIFNALTALSDYKVAWKEISGRISGKARLVAAVIPPLRDQHLGQKTCIPDHKAYLVPLKSEEEANFVVAILNSIPVRLAISSFMIETAISTQVLRNISLPRFDSSIRLHRELASIAKHAREIALNGPASDIDQLQEKVDYLVSKLYDISAPELKAAKDSLELVEPSEEDLVDENVSNEDDQDELD